MKLYLEILQDHFESIKHTKSDYTLKDLSADAGVKPGRMSDMFNGHYGLSETVARQIADNLNFDPATTEKFILSVRSHHARDQKSRSSAQNQLNELCQQSVDVSVSVEDFETVNDWYHLAIVHLVRKDPSLTISQLSERLSIAEEQTRSALQKLRSMGLIDHDNYFQYTEGALIAIGNETASKAIQKHHRQILNKAIEALPLTPLEKRDYASCQMFVDCSEISQIKDKLVAFRRQLIREHSKISSKSTLYSFSYQLFNLERARQ